MTKDTQRWIIPPIFAWEPNDLCMFLSLDAAESYLESWVEEAGIRVYDSEGKRLVAHEWPEARCAVWFSAPESPDRLVPDELRAVLLEWLTQRGRLLPVHRTWELPMLVAYFVEHRLGDTVD
jgi:hypothetical protein